MDNMIGLSQSLKTEQTLSPQMLQSLALLPMPILELKAHIQAEIESNPALEILGTILTRYDNRPRINRYLREAIAERGQEVGAPFLIGIRPGIAIREAQAMQQSLFDYAPMSKPAQDYKQLFELIQEG